MLLHGELCYCNSNHPQGARPNCSLLQVCGANTGYYLHMGTARRRSVEMTRAKQYNKVLKSGG
jgi:hypothetical protein